MNYKVEAEFEHEGLKCVVIMGNMGHRCGYVGISKDHALYGLNYSDPSPYLLRDKLMDEEIGDRGVMSILAMAFEESDNARPDYYFNVHGGITYAGGNDNYPIQSDLWWFGYDCGHCDDGKDLDKALEYGIITEESYNQIMSVERMFPIEEEVRTLDYCVNQCKSLAEQLNHIK